MEKSTAGGKKANRTQDWQESVAACASNVRTLATQMQDEGRRRYTRREAKTELQAGAEIGDGSGPGQGGATGAED